MTPREKVRHALETAHSVLDNIAKPMVNDGSAVVWSVSDDVPEDIYTAKSWVKEAIDQFTALASGSGDQIPGPDDVTAPSQMGFLSALGEAAWEQPPHTGSGDHAELAKRLWDRLDDEDAFAAASALEALLAENAALRAACSKSNDEISQTLGKALGYPWFKDDQINFPGATAENGVCVGDHVAESLADEAARRITEAERKLAEADQVIRDIAETPYTGADWPRSRAATYIASKEAERG
ncbi:hypothetical protein [Brevundimonas sp. CEF1]|uniref:hypothetical protein n=1 Tax=Brevundimonas sp. CEF1 TaxID=3442642 RepID=UPI003F51827E